MLSVPIWAIPVILSIVIFGYAISVNDDGYVGALFERIGAAFLILIIWLIYFIIY